MNTESWQLMLTPTNLPATTRPPEPSEPSGRFHNPLGWLAILLLGVTILLLVAWWFGFLKWLFFAALVALGVCCVIAGRVYDDPDHAKILGRD